MEKYLPHPRKNGTLLPYPISEILFRIENEMRYIGQYTEMQLVTRISTTYLIRRKIFNRINNILARAYILILCLIQKVSSICTQHNMSLDPITFQLLVTFDLVQLFYQKA